MVCVRRWDLRSKPCNYPYILGVFDLKASRLRPISVWHQSTLRAFWKLKELSVWYFDVIQPLVCTRLGILGNIEILARTRPGKMPRMVTLDYCDVFISCLDWRHPFTADDPLVSKWCNATFLQICSDEETNSSASWMAWECILFL